MFGSYKETVDYLYHALPIFQRVGASAYRNDLTNTLALCRFLGQPELKYKTVHVAGTNGKGSTSHFLASILQSAGYKVGLYTSPHLKYFTERIKVNGHEVSHEFVIDFVNRLKPLIEEIRPSFFEITVAMAFEYFAQQQVDVAVIEVGLGGRLDSTNVITPVLSVITNIDWDHMDLLGDSLKKIAIEKAGIIKPSVPVVISERQHEVEEVFVRVARECNSPISFASDHVKVLSSGGGAVSIFSGEKLIKTLSIPLKGNYQRKNIPGVMQAVKQLRAIGFSIDEEAMFDGLRKVVEQTGLKGRWQQLGTNPLVICDTGHNKAGVEEVMAQLREQTFKKLYVIWGVVKDKDTSSILKLLSRDAYYFFCKASIPRALDAHELAARATAAGLTGEVEPDVNEAIRKARAIASPDDLIFIGGSTFVVAEIENL